MRRSVEKTGQHIAASILDISGLRVLFVINEVLRQRLRHDILRLLLHVRSDETSFRSASSIGFEITIELPGKVERRIAI